MTRHLRFLIPAFFLLCQGFMGSAAHAAKIELQLWDEVTGFEKDALQGVVDDFNHSQSKIYVKLVSVPNINQKILVSTAGGVPPDVAVLSETNLAPMVAKEALVPLDAYVKKAGISAKDYVPVYWDLCQMEGHTWSLPHTPYVTALHWNKELFKKAGLDPEKPPRTFAELDAYARRLTKRDAAGNIVQIGFLPSDPSWLTYSWIYYFHGGLWDGHSHMTMNRAENVQAFQWVESYARSYGAGSLQTFTSGFGNYASAQNSFMSGKVAMAMDGVWLGNFIQQYSPKMKWGAAPFPVLVKGQDPVTMVGSSVMVIPKGARHADESFRFMAYMNSQGPMEKLCLGQSKNSPLAKVSPGFITHHKNPYIRMFQKLAQSRNAVHPPVIAIWNEIWTEMMSVFDKVWLLQATPQEALDGAQQRMQSSWDQELERRAHQPTPFLKNAPLYLSLLFVAAMALVVWASELKAKRHRGNNRIRGRLMRGLLFASPGLLGLGVFVLYPVASSLIYSFCDYSILTQPRWIGLDNFKSLMADDVFWISLKNSLIYAAASLPLSLLVAFVTAILLDTRVKGANLYRTLFYIPFITPLVASAMVWLWIFNTQYGVLNYLLKLVSFGTIGPIPWLSDAHWAMPSLVMMSLWGIGQNMVIMLAALQDVPVSVYEASEMDGAAWWAKIWYISIPFVSPVLYFSMLMGLIGSLQVFAVPYIMTGGGPARSTEFYSMYLWENAFNYLKMGYASAMAWILFLVILALSWVIQRMSASRVHYTGA